jgi:hypothetical protein
MHRRSFIKAIVGAALAPRVVGEALLKAEKENLPRFAEVDPAFATQFNWATVEIAERARNERRVGDKEFYSGNAWTLH